MRTSYLINNIFKLKHFTLDRILYFLNYDSLTTYTYTSIPKLKVQCILYNFNAFFKILSAFFKVFNTLNPQHYLLYIYLNIKKYCHTTVKTFNRLRDWEGRIGD